MKSVLITGGTGSFGNAFVERIFKQSTKPDRVVIFSRDEQKQEVMARKFSVCDSDNILRFFIGDVRDRDRLEFGMHGIDTVIHAAALKIVPAAEYNPTECIRTNVGGAENVVWASIKAGVKRVIALSTDKAVNPVNLYGASKLAAEKIFTAANSLAAGATRFSVVRYGNVSGSRGSVLPLFKRLAAEGKYLPITDRRMTRFWITMDQAIDLVFKAHGLMDGREIFIPRIPSIRIVDLAEAFMPNWYEIGIRPGEKLHECLITEDEARTTVEMPSYFTIFPDRRDTVPIYVDEGFRYTSDTNTKWLTPKEIEELIRD